MPSRSSSFTRRGFGKPRRRLGEMLGGIDLDRKHRLAAGQFRQQLIFAGDAGDTHEAIENQLAAGGAEDRFAAAGGGGDGDAGLVEFRRRPSGRRRSDSRSVDTAGIHPAPVCRGRLRGEAGIGGADRLVGFLALLLLEA